MRTTEFKGRDAAGRESCGPSRKHAPRVHSPSGVREWLLLPKEAQPPATFPATSRGCEILCLVHHCLPRVRPRVNAALTNSH